MPKDDSGCGAAASQAGAMACRPGFCAGQARRRGRSAYRNNLGKVEAERFISLIIREPFDYTEWQKDLFNNMSVKELSNLAMKEYGDK
jgi:hypothetical protein